MKEIEIQSPLLAEVEACLRDPNRLFELSSSTGPVDDILSATSAEELDALVATEAVGAEKLEGVNLRVQGVKWLPSAFEEEGFGVFALVSAQLEDMSHVLVTVGGGTPMAYLYKRCQLGTMPFGADEAIALFRAEKATKAGFKPWNVKRTKFEEGADPLRKF